MSVTNRASCQKDAVTKRGETSLGGVQALYSPNARVLALAADARRAVLVVAFPSPVRRGRSGPWERLDDPRTVTLGDKSGPPYRGRQARGARKSPADRRTETPKAFREGGLRRWVAKMRGQTRRGLVRQVPRASRPARDSEPASTHRSVDEHTDSPTNDQPVGAQGERSTRRAT
jgi:hypothetical protein